jgi:SGNH hydrolase-like domain, acetyltransferase AlgX
MRKLEWTSAFALLAVVAGFPLVQAVHEAVVDKEVPHVFDVFRRFPSKESLHRWDDNSKDRSVFAKWLRPVTLQLRYDLLGEMAPKSVKGEEDWLFYNQDVDYLLQPPYTDDRFYKGTFDTLIAGKRVNVRNPLVAMEDFRDRLKARGIDLLLVPIPGKPSIYPEKLWHGIHGQPASPTLALLEDLKKRGFNVADLFHPLMAAKEAGAKEAGAKEAGAKEAGAKVAGDNAAGAPQLYLKRDTHWTPQGMEVAAEAVAGRIKEMVPDPDTAAVLVPRDSVVFTPRYLIKDTTVARWGDIAEMTKVPDRRKIWPEESVRATQIQDAKTGRPYQDDPASSILWLGDSYSRIYQTDAPGGAGIIAHVAYKLNRPLASIVNDGGASTVVRQQLARRGELLQGKKLVVWTFVERDLRFGSKGWQVQELP